MSEVKEVKTRIKNLYGTAGEWETVQNNFTPEKGEIVVIADADTTTSKIKIGDGSTKLSELDYSVDRSSDLETISSLSTRVGTVETDINKENTGIKAKLSKLESDLSTVNTTLAGRAPAIQVQTQIPSGTPTEPEGTLIVIVEDKTTT